MSGYLNRSGDLAVTLVRGDDRAGGRRPALVHWAEAFSGPHRDLWLQLVWAGGTLRARGDDAFAALDGIRGQLEPPGWLVAVQGARRDTYPSGMARDMAGGFAVFVLSPGRAPGPDDLVATFDPADPELVTTVADQQDSWRRWQEALRGGHSGTGTGAHP